MAGEPVNAEAPKAPAQEAPKAELTVEESGDDDFMNDIGFDDM